MKNLLSLLIVILLPCIGISQVNFMGYLVDANNNKLKNVEVNLYQGNEKLSTKNWSKKFEYDLELEAAYTLELVKEGFIAKRIAISTYEGDKGAEPFLFVMQLIAKTDGVEGIDEDYPSALIKYKKDQGTFNFDVQYAKSIKKQEKEAKRKRKSVSN